MKKLTLNDSVYAIHIEKGEWSFGVDRDKFFEEFGDYEDEIQIMTLKEIFDAFTEEEEFDCGEWMSMACGSIMAHDIENQEFYDLADDYFYYYDPEREAREEYEWHIYRRETYVRS